MNNNSFEICNKKFKSDFNIELKSYKEFIELTKENINQLDE